MIQVKLRFDLYHGPCHILLGEGGGTPLQYSCLENPMDGGASWAAVYGVTNSRARLSHFTFTFHFHALEKEMATHSTVLAWRIPGQLVGCRLWGRRVGHDWSDLAAAAAAAVIVCWFVTDESGNKEMYWLISCPEVAPWAWTTWLPQQLIAGYQSLDFYT